MAHRRDAWRGNRGHPRATRILNLGAPLGVREGVFVARIAGRSSWFAWFVGLVSAAVLGALVYLAAPLAPAVGDWTVRTVATGIQQLVSGSTSNAPADPLAQPDGPVSGPVMPANCDGLFTAKQHQQLASDSAVMSTGAGEVLVAVPGVAELLGAVPVVDCRWVTPAGGSAQALVATVAEGAVATADELLRAVGFACTPLDGGVSCVRSTAATAEAGGAVETHVIRGTVWVASVTTGWQPDGFTEAVDAAVWPSA